MASRSFGAFIHLTNVLFAETRRGITRELTILRQNVDSAFTSLENLTLLGTVTSGTYSKRTEADVDWLQVSTDAATTIYTMSPNLSTGEQADMAVVVDLRLPGVADFA